MWILEIALCLQLSATEGECRREVQGPHVARLDCWDRIAGQKDALKALSEDLDAKVLFLSVACKKGVDG